MNISIKLLTILLLFSACSKEASEPIEEVVLLPWENSFLSFTKDDSIYDYEILANDGSISSALVSFGTQTIEDDVFMINIAFVYRKPIIQDNQHIQLSFRKYFMANNLENSVYIEQWGFNPDYQLTLNEILQAIKVGQYRNVQESNIVQGKDYIKLTYHENLNVSYKYYFTNGFIEEPATEHYFEIKEIELLDNCSFSFQGIFSGDENSEILNDTNRITNGKFEGYYYNSKDSLCTQY